MSFSLFNGLHICSASKVAALKIFIFKLVSAFAGIPIQKCIQMPRAVKSSLATSKQAGKNYGDVDMDQ